MILSVLRVRVSKEVRSIFNSNVRAIEYCVLLHTLNITSTLISQSAEILINTWKSGDCIINSIIQVNCGLARI